MQIQFCEIPQNRAYFIYSQNYDKQLNTIKDELANVIVDMYQQSVSQRLTKDKITLHD